MKRIRRYYATDTVLYSWDAKSLDYIANQTHSKMKMINAESFEKIKFVFQYMGNSVIYINFLKNQNEYFELFY